MYSSDTPSLLGSSMAALGSVIATGTGWYSGKFGCLSTVGDQGFQIGAISGSSIENVSALNGATFSFAPNNFLGTITAFRLSSGICQAVRIA